MIFVDASALTAILLREADAERFLKVLTPREGNVTSAVAVWETAVAVAKARPDLPAARTDVATVLTILNIQVLPIGPAEQEAALDAFALYGKGRHPARLNMGDCFAYACAKALGAKLLYKGDDFSQTDITPAV